MDNPDKEAKNFARMTGDLNGVQDSDTFSGTTGLAERSRAGTPSARNTSMCDILIMLSWDNHKSKEEITYQWKKRTESMELIKDVVKVRVEDTLEKISNLRWKNETDEEVISEFRTYAERIVNELKGTQKELRNTYKILDNKICRKT